jgi:CheY-like chemotaxis protein
VISNLLNNAARYSEPGSKIELTARSDGKEAVIRVRDNGIGISQDMLPRIFDPFLQVDNSLERSQGGLGIGLTLVKQVVKMHSGRVEAASEGLGKGTEFAVWLPVVEMGEVSAASPGNASPPAARGSRRRVLVVDDLRDSADALALMLEMDGHEVRTAYDGAEAARAAMEFQAEVVLLDIGMPILNGYDAARRIREQCGSQEILLIAITGWGHEENRRRTKEAGFDLHLVKPIEPDLLRQVMASAASTASRA